MKDNQINTNEVQFINNRHESIRSVLPMTTPDQMEASLTIAPDGAAPVFHMVRLPDSVVFEQVIKRASFYPRLPSVVGNQRLKQRERVYITWHINDTRHVKVFLAKSSDDGKTISQTIVLSTPNKEHVIDQNASIAASVYVHVTCWIRGAGFLSSK